MSFFMGSNRSMDYRETMKRIHFLKDFIYLFMRDTQREGQRHRQREKQAPWRDPNVGLDPRTPGSCPGPQADAQQLSHPGIPVISIVIANTLSSQLAGTGKWGGKKRKRDGFL